MYVYVISKARQDAILYTGLAFEEEERNRLQWRYMYVEVLHLSVCIFRIARTPLASCIQSKYWQVILNG